MIRQARQFAEQGFDDLAAPRRVDAEEFLDRQSKADVVVERGEVIEAVGERYELVVAPVFAQFLEAGVEEADFLPGLDDPFAAHFHVHAQGAVRGGMRRPDVEMERALGLFDDFLLVGIHG